MATLAAKAVQTYKATSADEFSSVPLVVSLTRRLEHCTALVAIPTRAVPVTT